MSRGSLINRASQTIRAGSLYKTASCQVLSVRDAQLVTTLQVFIRSPSMMGSSLYLFIITLVILAHNYLASYPYEMRGEFSFNISVCSPLPKNATTSQGILGCCHFSWRLHCIVYVIFPISQTSSKFGQCQLVMEN